MTGKKKTLQKKEPPKKSISDNTITLLINAPIYFIDYAIIVFQEKQWRLVVHRRGEIFIDKLYPGIKGAKIGFIKVLLAFCIFKRVQAGVESPLCSQ